jgi:hypothetical protein
MQLIQLDFFQEKTEVELLRDEVRGLSESNTKVRKSLFARHGELAKLYLDLLSRMEVIERHLCQK